MTSDIYKNNLRVCVCVVFLNSLVGFARIRKRNATAATIAEPLTDGDRDDGAFFIGKKEPLT